MKVRAAFAGTEPDPELTPAAVAGLLAEGIDVRGHRPRRVTGDDITHASRVVSFGCEPGALAPGVAVERWDDVPAVSDDYRAARDVIVSRLPALLASSTSDRGATHVGGADDRPNPTWAGGPWMPWSFSARATQR